MADSTTTSWHFLGEEDRFGEDHEFLGTWLMFMDQNEELHYVKRETNDVQ